MMIRSPVISLRMMWDARPESREGFDALPCVLRCSRRIYPAEASVSERLKDEKRRLHPNQHEWGWSNYRAIESCRGCVRTRTHFTGVR